MMTSYLSGVIINGRDDEFKELQKLSPYRMLPNSGKKLLTQWLKKIL